MSSWPVEAPEGFYRTFTESTWRHIRGTERELAKVRARLAVRANTSATSPSPTTAEDVGR